jgi:hypothetical protein
MSKTKIPAAALLVIGAMSLGVPAIAAPVTPLSAAARPMSQESDLVQVRYGGWHGGWGGWHGGRGFAAGALAGALIGAAIAGPYYGGGYYPSYDDDYGYLALPYGYAPGYYPAYGYAPGYYPGYGYHRCYPYCRWGG